MVVQVIVLKTVNLKTILLVVPEAAVEVVQAVVISPKAISPGAAVEVIQAVVLSPKASPKAKAVLLLSPEPVLIASVVVLLKGIKLIISFDLFIMYLLIFYLNNRWNRPSLFDYGAEKEANNCKF